MNIVNVFRDQWQLGQASRLYRLISIRDRQKQVIDVLYADDIQL